MRSAIACALLATACAAPEDPASAGRRLFARACARCHGEEGTGGVAPAGAAAPRNFQDPAFWRDRTDAQLRRSIREGTARGMPPFRGTFSDEQVGLLVAHLHTFAPPTESSP